MTDVNCQVKELMSKGKIVVWEGVLSTGVVTHIDKSHMSLDVSMTGAVDATVTQLVLAMATAVVTSRRYDWRGVGHKGVNV